MIDFFLSTLSFGCPLWLALGGFFSTWRLLPPTPNIFSVPTTCASLGYTFVGFPAAFTSYSNSSIPAEATVYFSVLEHAFAASPVIFLYDALYLSLFVHGTPKDGSGPEMFWNLCCHLFWPSFVQIFIWNFLDVSVGKNFQNIGTKETISIEHGCISTNMKLNPY